MTIIIAHLSDIHIKSEKDKILEKSEKIAEKIRSHQSPNKTCLLVVSGDIAYGGNADEYKLATTFFDTIKNSLKGCFKTDIEIILAPGNHDCNFSESNSVREMVVNGLTSRTDQPIDDSIINQCSSIQKDFFEFRDKICLKEKSTDKKLWTRYDFEIDEKIISFDCLNLSWCSKKSEGQGDLVFPIDNFCDELKNKSDLRFFVFHHPLNWIKQGQYQKLRSKIRAHADIVLCGHEHYGSATEINDKKEGESVIIDACCLQENGGSHDSEFSIINIDLINGSFEYEKQSYVDDDYKILESYNNGSIFKNTPRILRNGLSISDAHMKWLVNPGANFTHPYKQNIELADIFVYPHIEESTARLAEKNITSSSKIVSNIENQEKILIKGDEKHGKTSLLKILNANFFDLGYTPLFIDASKISKASSKELGKFFTKCIEHQYGNDSKEKFLSIQKSKKIILIDSFEKSKVADRFQWKVLEHSRGQADKIIVTSSSSMEFSELIVPEMSSELSFFKHYNLKHFGNRLRYDLIKKWRSIGNDYNLSSSDLIARVDQSEKILNSVIGKNLVPRVPVYILTILQSLEGGNQNTEFHNGGLGYYYQYLITQALGKAEVSADELDAFFNFLSNLSWFFYNEGSEEVEELTIEKFIDAYSKEYTRINSKERLKRLMDSRILHKKGSFYSFSYSYIYYYFLGKYFSQHMSSSEEIQAIISRACQHIYVHENSHIVMFLTHHSKDKAIISDILNNLKGLFDKHKPISFDGDTESISNFVDETVHLVYNNSNPDDIRKNHATIQDKYEEEEDKNKEEIRNKRVRERT